MQITVFISTAPHLGHVSTIIFQRLQSLHHHLHGLVRHGSAAGRAKVSALFNIRHCVKCIAQTTMRIKVSCPLTPHPLHLLSADGAEGVYCHHLGRRIQRVNVILPCAPDVNGGCLLKAQSLLPASCSWFVPLQFFPDFLLVFLPFTKIWFWDFIFL